MAPQVKTSASIAYTPHSGVESRVICPYMVIIDTMYIDSKHSLHTTKRRGEGGRAEWGSELSSDVGLQWASHSL
jgi:hypothetical protein